MTESADVDCDFLCIFATGLALDVMVLGKKLSPTLLDPVMR